MQIEIFSPVFSHRRTLRVCAYCRVSTDTPLQSCSLENQTNYYNHLIARNPKWRFAGIYADQGISGFGAERPEFDRMLRNARAGRIDRILTKSISRFGRNTAAVLKTVRELREIGVGVIFEEQRIDSLSMEGEIMLSVCAAFAEEELRSLSETMRWSHRRMFAEGNTRKIVQSRFLGYGKDPDGKLTIDENEAAVVRRIYLLCLSGLGAKAIAERLNAEGTATISGKRWRDCGVRYILRNEKYKGDFLLQKTWTPRISGGSVLNRGEMPRWYVQDDHPAIISREDWERVQEIMDSRNTRKGRD